MSQSRIPGIGTSLWFYLCDFHNLVEDVVPEVREFVSIIAKVHEESMGKEHRCGFDMLTHLIRLPHDNSWQSL